MIGCDASQENCLSYLGDYYRCDGSVQTGGAQGGPLDAYVCSCVSQVVDAPQRGGSFSFPGAVPRSGGCGLPLVAPAPPAGPPSSTSLSVALPSRAEPASSSQRLTSSAQLVFVYLSSYVYIVQHRQPRISILCTGIDLFESRSFGIVRSFRGIGIRRIGS